MRDNQKAGIPENLEFFEGEFWILLLDTTGPKMSLFRGLGGVNRNKQTTTKGLSVLMNPRVSA
jgi:hypothetical protein